MGLENVNGGFGKSMSSLAGRSSVGMGSFNLVNRETVKEKDKMCESSASKRSSKGNSSKQKNNKSFFG